MEKLLYQAKGRGDARKNCNQLIYNNNYSA